jgi:hypothetical protein
MRPGFGKDRLQYIVRVGGSRQQFHDGIGFCYETKATVLHQSLARPGRRLCPKIAKIEYGESDVYDIEVEGDHSYLANGVISHNSEMPLQMMEAKGFTVDKHSVDRDKTSYYSWRTGFEELRIRPYRQYQFLREAEQLLDGDKKIDHPRDGSKDTVDAMAASYTNAINSDEKFNIITSNEPSVYMGGTVESMSSEKPPIDINLPMGYTRVKTFNV